MKLLLALLLVLGLVASSVDARDVHVRGYTRKDGTYVRPHTRSSPGSGSHGSSSSRSGSSGGGSSAPSYEAYHGSDAAPLSFCTTPDGRTYIGDNPPADCVKRPVR